MEENIFIYNNEYNTFNSNHQHNNMCQSTKKNHTHTHTHTHTQHALCAHTQFLYKTTDLVVLHSPACKAI